VPAAVVIFCLSAEEQTRVVQEEEQFELLHTRDDGGEAAAKDF